MMRRKTNMNNILNQIKVLTEAYSAIEKNLESMNKRLEKLTEVVEKSVSILTEQRSEHPFTFRAKTERLPEHAEHMLVRAASSERVSRDKQLKSIRGRHREILVMLINNGFHTYEQIAEKLGISQSRARAYIADLRNHYGVPLKQVRDPEGYKIGIDVRFVEQILAPK